MSSFPEPSGEGTFRDDLTRGRFDVPFFAKRFFGVELHPGQVRFAEACIARRAERPWEAAFWDVRVKAGNRAGKTLGLAIIIFHHCFYKIGLLPPNTEQEMRKLLTHPYAWYHLAISQEISYLVYYELLMLFSGNHPAQKGRGCPLIEQVPDLVKTTEKWAGQWHYIQLSDVWGGATIHFRTTAEKAVGTLGRDMNGISVDEADFEPHIAFIYAEVLNLRRLGTAGPIIMVATLTQDHDGSTDYLDLWNEGDPKNIERKPRIKSLTISTRENIGFGLDQATFDALIANMTPEEVAQNIDGQVVAPSTAFFNPKSVDAMFTNDLPELKTAENGHVYAQGVDPALTYDECWSIVLDVTDQGLWKGVECGYLRGRKTTDDILELMISQYNAFEQNRNGLRSSCSLALDATGMGGKMIRERLTDAGVFDIKNIEFGGRTQTKGKRKVMADMRSVIDSGKLRLPRSGPWLGLRKQLLSYRVDITKPKDDGIMALGCAIQQGLRYGGFPVGANSVPFDARSTISRSGRSGAALIPR